MIEVSGDELFIRIGHGMLTTSSKYTFVEKAIVRIKNDLALDRILTEVRNRVSAARCRRRKEPGLSTQFLRPEHRKQQRRHPTTKNLKCIDDESPSCTTSDVTAKPMADPGDGLRNQTGRYSLW